VAIPRHQLLFSIEALQLYSIFAYELVTEIYIPSARMIQKRKKK